MPADPIAPSAIGEAHPDAAEHARDREERDRRAQSRGEDAPELAVLDVCNQPGFEPGEADPERIRARELDAELEPYRTDVSVIPDILSAVVEEVHRIGVHGEDDIIRLLYLAVTSRLLDRPVNIAVKGPSSGGKSFLTGKTLSLFPAEAFVLLSSMSERALIYDEESLIHRTVVLYEAAGMASDTAAYVIRSLLSEGCIDYKVTVKDKGGDFKVRTIHRDGPTGLITTTTAVHLNAELETRLVSALVADDAGQTKAVMLKAAKGISDPTPDPDFITHQQWLALMAEQHREGRPNVPLVVVPFAESLAGLIPPAAVRLRRDFATLLTLIKAHALLHATTRERDERGSIVAMVEPDYRAVERFFTPLVSDAVEMTVPSTIRETVVAVGVLAKENGSPSMSTLARHLGIDKSSASRRVATAVEGGYIVNAEPRPGRYAKLHLGPTPLPENVRILPTVAGLLQRCSVDGVGTAENAGRQGAH